MLPSHERNTIKYEQNMRSQLRLRHRQTTDEAPKVPRCIPGIINRATLM